MKKSIVTLLAVAALAPAATVFATETANNAHKDPDTKYGYVVENLGLKVATAKAYADAAKAEFDSVSANVTGREATLNATKIDVATAEKAVADKVKEKDDTVGLLNMGTPVEGFKNVQAAIEFFDKEIAALNATLETRKTAQAEAQKDLDAWVAKKAEAAKKLEDALAKLDAAIAEARGAGMTEEQVNQAKNNGTVAVETPEAKKAAKTVAAAKTATTSKALPKTSAAK
ncbi:hypothetical protein [Streptococcus merionis]|uniref:hypothetical protein n=1 Tax=Streptococcus merionis TaxID=400065 RepID=UPI0035159030